MKDSTRQLLLFGGIIVIGSVMIFVDIPPILLILGVCALALALLVSTGAITGQEIKGSLKGMRAALSRRERAKKKTAKKSAPKAKDQAGGKRAQGEDSIFSTMRQGIGALFKDLGKGRKDRKKESEAPAQVKDSSVRGKGRGGGGAPSLMDASADIVPLTKESEPDPFLSIGNDPIDEDVLDSISPDMDGPLFDDIDPLAGNQGGDGGDVTRLEIALDREEEEIEIDQESDDEVNSILEANMGILNQKGGDAADAGVELTDLGAIDMGSVNVDPGMEARSSPGSSNKGGGGPEPQAPVSASKPLSSAKAAQLFGGGPAPSMSTGKTEGSDEYEMVGFATGDKGDDDLMAALKSDVQNVKQDDSGGLMRDLKGSRVTVNALESELREILEGGKSKLSKTKKGVRLQQR
jgi:hypothetical protein